MGVLRHTDPYGIGAVNTIKCWTIKQRRAVYRAVNSTLQRDYELLIAQWLPSFNPLCKTGDNCFFQV